MINIKECNISEADRYPKDEELIDQRFRQYFLECKGPEEDRPQQMRYWDFWIMTGEFYDEIDPDSDSNSEPNAGSVLHPDQKSN